MKNNIIKLLAVIGICFVPTLFLNHEIVIILSFLFLITIGIVSFASVLDVLLNDYSSKIAINITNKFKKPNTIQLLDDVQQYYFFETALEQLKCKPQFGADVISQLTQSYKNTVGNYLNQNTHVRKAMGKFKKKLGTKTSQRRVVILSPRFTRLTSVSPNYLITPTKVKQVKSKPEKPTRNSSKKGKSI